MFLSTPDRRRRSLAALLAVLVVAAAVAAMRPQDEAPTHSFRVVLGLNDPAPTDWSGRLAVAGGEVVSLTGWRFEQKDAVQGTTAWKCSSRLHIAPERRYPIQDADGKPKGKAVESVWPNGVLVTVRGKNPTLTLSLPQREVKFQADQIRLGEPVLPLAKGVRIERLPTTRLLRPAAPFKKATRPVQDDYPAFWVRYKTGKHYLAWVAYQNEKTRVLLAERDGPTGVWSDPVEVSGPGDHFRVSIASIHGDTFWLVWSRRIGENWDLYGRPYTNGKLGAEVRLTDDPGPDLWQRMTTDNRGRAWLVWQGFRNGQSDIFARCVDGDGWHEPIRVSKAPANDWNPVVAADTREDRVWFGWDTYENGNYNVRVRALAGGPKGKLGPVLEPEPSPNFHAHVSLACDRDGRLWCAFDESGPNWGKDTGFLFDNSKATRLYQSRAVRIKCLDNGRWLEPNPPLDSVLPADLKEFNELPQLQGDLDGRMWLAFRHRTCRRPRADGWAIQARWDVYATAFLGDRWLAPVELPASVGRLDMRIDSQRDPQGSVYFAFASDNRPWQLPQMPPRNLSIAVSQLDAKAAKPVPPQLVPVAHQSTAKPVHPDEKAQVARMRNYKIEAGGKVFRIYRGDLHRHTDISGDGMGDGSLMDLHRYALDAAALDYVMVGDHNMGNDDEYTWWRTQQANDLYTVPGAFISVYGYERSVRYPNGHRNVIWAERGHRTLPLPQQAIPAQMKADTARLYDYLRKTNGICTSHTAASDQGTDWEDAHDPALEPFVELFQGYHTSYEALGAPKAIDDKTDMIHGKYQPAGFVSKALDKGYRLGFQASSDHISTHVSYACVLAEDFTRKGLVEAMKQRHSYAATDNIILDVRLGGNVMGDEVRGLKPRFDVVVIGTGPLDRVEVLRNGEVMHVERPGKAEARFTWEDANLLRGEKASYYYVRVRQQDGQMAWASPIWVSGS
jgi:hypothetical protein